MACFGEVIPFFSPTRDLGLVQDGGAAQPLPRRSCAGWGGDGRPSSPCTSCHHSLFHPWPSLAALSLLPAAPTSHATPVPALPFPSQPFWPLGTGVARGFLAAFDAAWMVRRWAAGTPPLEVLAER